VGCAHRNSLSSKEELPLRWLAYSLSKVDLIVNTLIFGGTVPYKTDKISKSVD